VNFLLHTKSAPERIFSPRDPHKILHRNTFFCRYGLRSPTGNPRQAPQEKRGMTRKIADRANLPKDTTATIVKNAKSALDFSV